jgi:hypothetical protein
VSVLYNVTDWTGWAFVELADWLFGLAGDEPATLPQKAAMALGSAFYSVGNWFYGVRP